jgi:hypothetical protein
MKTRWFVTGLTLAGLWLAACSPIEPPQSDEPKPTHTPAPGDVVSATPLSPDQPSPTDESPPYAPQPGDAALVRETVFLDANELLIAESYPLQIFLQLRGSLPTPCHQLRASIAAPDAQNRIMVEAYAVVDGDRACIQVLKSFEQSVRLGSFPSGHYTVWVNGEQVGEFDA